MDNIKIYKEEKFGKGKILLGDLKRLPDDFFKVVVFIDNAYLLRVKKYFFNEVLKYCVRNVSVMINGSVVSYDVYLKKKRIEGIWGLLDG